MVEREEDKFLSITRAAKHMEVCRNTFYKYYLARLRFITVGKRKFFSVADMNGLLQNINPPIQHHVEVVVMD